MFFEFNEIPHSKADFVVLTISHPDLLEINPKVVWLVDGERKTTD